MKILKLAAVGASFFLLLLGFFSLGSWITCYKKTERFSPGLTLLIGFFAYYVVFQVVTVPFMFLQVPLHVLSIVWFTLLGVVIISAVIRFRAVWMEYGKNVVTNWSGNIYTWILWGIVLFSVGFVMLVYRAYWDATYYVGMVSFSVYYDTINTIDPTTGLLYSYFDLKHSLATYHMNDAVFCQVLRVHPLIQTKTVMTVIVVLLQNLTYYKIGQKLFQDSKKAVACFMSFVMLLLVFSYSDYTTSGFILYRTYEGKAIAAGLVMPMLFLMFLYLWDHFEKIEYWRFLLLVSWGAVAISSSAMILVPVAISAYVVSRWFTDRKIQYMWRYIMVMMPCLCVLAVYLLNRMGVLLIPVKG